MKREIKTEKKYKKRDIGENSVRKLESELFRDVRGLGRVWSLKSIANSNQKVLVGLGQICAIFLNPN